MEQKHINVIRTCLKIVRAFGDEQSKIDVEEALIAFDKAVKENTISASFAGEVPKKPRVDDKL